MTDDIDLTALAEQLGQQLTQRKLTLTLAESCTGGLCAEIITRVAGSSVWFECGFITYSNQSKEMLLNVSSATLSDFGAVSEETAIEMAMGAFGVSGASLSAAVTGIAGPTGGTEAKPLGTVCFAWIGLDCAPISATHHFIGNRQEIRQQSAKTLIEGLITLTLSLDL
ncbi:MAG: CinA family protein [Methylotenera sp.]|nr:CinA family protein [Methylotenera sp.]MSP99664.1 CinA family protein [Methylotenera sp.]